MAFRERLIELRKELFDFSGRNPFVDIRKDNIWFDDSNKSAVLPGKLYRKANFYWKEYGLETSLEVYVFMKWLPPDGTKAGAAKYLTSPLVYRPVKIKRIRKIETSYTVSAQTNLYVVNPVLRHYFKLYFDLELPDEVENTEEVIDCLLTYFNEGVGDSAKQIERRTDFSDEESWQLIEQNGVGIFNYKKSALGADYATILEAPNDQVKGIFGELEVKESTSDFSDNDGIAFLDHSQKQVLAEAITRSTVIQGPPGTGKSHTIVALIGAFLSQQKKVLFVSEKRSALEVVNNRLKRKGLDPLLAYFNTNKDQKKHFYLKLKQTWEFISGYTEDKRVAAVSKQKGLFEFYPGGLKKDTDATGVCLNDLIQILLEANLPLKELNAIGRVPDYKSWKGVYSFLLEFEKNCCEAFHVSSIGESYVAQLNSVVFSESAVMPVLEKRLNSMEGILERINQLQSDFELDVPFENFIRLALTASILSMVDKIQIDLLNTESKKYKSFNSRAKKYQLVQTKLKQAELANEKWSKKPSMSEITELMDLLKTSERQQGSGVFRLLRRNPARLKTAFADFHPGIGVHTKIKLLEAVQLEWRLKGELDEIKVKLKHNLNINDPENEIDLIFNLRNKLTALSQNEYLFILEHEQSGALIKALSGIHPEIVQFNAQNRFLFRKNEVLSTKAFAMRVQDLKRQLPAINHWLPELKRFYRIPADVRGFIQENRRHIHILNAVVAYQNLLETTRFEPLFKRLTGWELVEQARKEKQQVELTCALNIKEILNNVVSAQNEAEALAVRPGFKLDEKQKALKKRYKSERRVILHEVNKQQRHLPVKRFFEMTADHVTKIQPVWFMNPLTVSENLPCLPDLFDVVIFDESSQIPLEDAIPAIYRAKQVVVVGDSKQMPPSAFFTSKEETLTLLDQSEQVFPNKMLKWHYRSQHPDLIQFSNEAFYQNELVTFPPQSTAVPIEVKRVEGNYQSGKNEKEAASIAAFCQTLSDKEQKRTTIIAFSQEQEKEIRRQLTLSGIKPGEEEEGIQTRNLENAQGIEAARIIVSVGYGKAADGSFRLNFGPVNQVNGANRLNVLFTRAIEKMVVFTSVQSRDFQLSENKGVTVLRDFLAYAEQLENMESRGSVLTLAEKKVEKIMTELGADYVYYPAGKGIGFSSFIHHQSNKIVLIDPGLGTSPVESALVTDVSSLLTVLLEHYNDVQVILSLDLWLNPERVKGDLRHFFG